MKATSKNIAVNARFLIKDKLQGIGRFSHEVLSRLVMEMPDYQFHFAFDRPYHKDFIYRSNVTPHVLSPPARHPVLWYIYFELSVRRWLNKGNYSCFFSPDSFLSLGSDVPTLLVVHDLAYEHYPEHVSFLARRYYQKYFPKYARKATKIATVSQYTRADLMSKYGIDGNKVSVVYNGVSSEFYPRAASENEATRAEYSDSKPFFAFVGSLNPRKNLIRVIQAFESFKIENSETKLLLIGAEGWKNSAFKETLDGSKYKSDIILTGHVSENDLARLLSAAEALVFPSLFEGFGIPIIEAFASNTAVITSDSSSMPEVAGDAAIIVNPQSVSEISNAMSNMMLDEIREKFENLGMERAAKFNWDDTAKKLAEDLRKLAR